MREVLAATDSTSITGLTLKSEPEMVSIQRKKLKPPAASPQEIAGIGRPDAGMSAG
jgi:hypothetical protein